MEKRLQYICLMQSCLQFVKMHPRNVIKRCAEGNPGLILGITVHWEGLQTIHRNTCNKELLIYFKIFWHQNHLSTLFFSIDLLKYSHIPKMHIFEFSFNFIEVLLHIMLAVFLLLNNILLKWIPMGCITTKHSFFSKFSYLSLCKTGHFQIFTILITAFLNFLIYIFLCMCEHFSCCSFAGSWGMAKLKSDAKLFPKLC